MGKITFIIGGARSGKSQHAMRLAGASGRPVTYVATGEGKDEEMRTRIAGHRNCRPDGWVTIEEPRAVSRHIGPGNDPILIDCLTLLVSNLMLRKETPHTIETEMRRIISALRKRKGPGIIVSNEVGLGIVPANRLARDFRDVAGTANKIVAEAADRVIFMVAGLPWQVKQRGKRP